MPDTSAPTDPNALLFPAFLYGDNATCRRLWRAEAKKWGTRFEAHGDFPEPKLIPVQPGSVIWTNDGAAEMLMLGDHERRKKPHWHFYHLKLLDAEASPGGPARALFDAAYEDFVRRYPWGALALIIDRRTNTTVDLVARRLEAVLSFWEQLDTLRYIDLHLKKLDLAALITFYTHEFVLAWADAPIGRPVKEVLRETMERMRNASEDEIQKRMMRRLHEVIDTDPNLKHREWLKSSGVLEADLASTRETNPDLCEYMKTGEYVSHYLAKLDKKYPGS